MLLTSTIGSSTVLIVLHDSELLSLEIFRRPIVIEKFQNNCKCEQKIRTLCYVIENHIFTESLPYCLSRMPAIQWQGLESGNTITISFEPELDYDSHSIWP